MLICDDFSKKCHVTFKMFLLLLWSYLICVPRFRSINNSSLPRKIWCPFYKVIGGGYTKLRYEPLWVTMSHFDPLWASMSHYDPKHWHHDPLWHKWQYDTMSQPKKRQKKSFTCLNFVRKILFLVPKFKNALS